MRCGASSADIGRRADMTDFMDTPTVTLAGARRAIDAAVAHAAALGVAIVVTVVDAAGHVKASARMDGAPLFSVEISRKKAWTAAAADASTAAMWQDVEGSAVLLHGVQPAVEDFLAIGGGTPLRSSEVVAGAVGVSGATAEQDQEIADAGAAALSG